MNPKVTELQESLRNMPQDIDSKKQELSDVENKPRNSSKKNNSKLMKNVKIWKTGSTAECNRIIVTVERRITCDVFTWGKKKKIKKVSIGSKVVLDESEK